MIFGMPHPGLGGGWLAVPGATDSNGGGGCGVGPFLRLLLTGLVMHPAGYYLPSPLIYISVQNVSGSTGALGPCVCWTGAFHTLKERQPWNPFPGPVGSCSVKGCRELATRLWIALPHHMATDIMARAVTIATLSLQAHHGPGLVPKAIPVSFKLILRSHHCPS